MFCALTKAQNVKYENCNYYSSKNQGPVDFVGVLGPRVMRHNAVNQGCIRIRLYSHPATLMQFQIVNDLTDSKMAMKMEQELRTHNNYSQKANREAHFTLLFFLRSNQRIILQLDQTQALVITIACRTQTASNHITVELSCICVAKVYTTLFL
jgi:hypothetical protein